MTDQDFVEAIRRTERIVMDSGLDPDSARGVAAFAGILERLTGSRDEPVDSDTRQEVREPRSDESGPVGQVARWTDVSTEVLLDAFEFGPDQIELNIWHGRLPRSKAERQRLLTLAKLGAERIGYERGEVSARELNELCERYECLDQNLPTNIQQRNVVQRRGQRGSFTYRLTLAGVDTAREAIRRLVGAD